MRHAAFLVFLMFLWEAERGVSVSDRDHCTRNGCFSVVQGDFDFTSAEKHCNENFFGHLMTIKSPKEHNIILDLLNGFSGEYWIGLKLPDGKCPDRSTQLLGYEWTTTGGNNTDFNNWDQIDPSCSAKCVSVSAGHNSTWQQRPCDSKLRGALCTYSFDVNACDTLPENADHLVRYITPRGSAAVGLERFPPGGTAIQKPLDVKHICFFGQWLKAPWPCEVMKGGCEHGCVSHNETRIHSCTCPPGQSLRGNNVTCSCSAGQVLAMDGKSCVVDGCHGCTLNQECVNNECMCRDGFVDMGGKSCVVDGCHGCTGQHQECVNNKCICRDGFDFVDKGDELVCVNIEICFKCEHIDIDCVYKDGAFGCACRNRYKVSDKDPTKCLPHCTERTCDAFDCVSNPEKPGLHPCHCPDGFMKDASNETRIVCEDRDECFENQPCDQDCTNTFGSYVCSCWEGYELVGDRCVPTDDFGDGSGSVGPHLPVIKPTASSLTPPGLTPPVVGLPQYVKAGSILGISLFVALLMILLYFLAHNALKRCGKFELESLRGTDVDIFHLQQVTTEKYQKFSFDKQWKNDSQRL